jgi:hypothetical protein
LAHHKVRLSSRIFGVKDEAKVFACYLLPFPLYWHNI